MSESVFLLITFGCFEYDRATRRRGEQGDVFILNFWAGLKCEVGLKSRDIFPIQGVLVSVLPGASGTY